MSSSQSHVKCYLCRAEVDGQEEVKPSSVSSVNSVFSQWADTCAQSLQTILGLDNSFQTMLAAATYCTSCITIVRDLNFVLKAIGSLQERLSKSRAEVELLLKSNYSAVHRIIEDALDPLSDVKVGIADHFIKAVGDALGFEVHTEDKNLEAMQYIVPDLSVSQIDESEPRRPCRARRRKEAAICRPILPSWKPTDFDADADLDDGINPRPIQQGDEPENNTTAPLMALSSRKHRLLPLDESEPRRPCILRSHKVRKYRPILLKLQQSETLGDADPCDGINTLPTQFELLEPPAPVPEPVAVRNSLFQLILVRRQQQQLLVQNQEGVCKPSADEHSPDQIKCAISESEPAKVVVATIYPTDKNHSATVETVERSQHLLGAVSSPSSPSCSSATTDQEHFLTVKFEDTSEDESRPPLRSDQPPNDPVLVKLSASAEDGRSKTYRPTQWQKRKYTMKQRPTGRTRDPIWDKFTIMGRMAETKRPLARCNSCQASVSGEAGRLKNHFNRCQGIGSSEPAAPLVAESELDKAVSKFIFSINLPFSTVNNNEFKEMFKLLRPSYTPPCKINNC